MSRPDPADDNGAAPTAQSLALTVCRLCLDPATGRLRHRSRVGIAVRAAVFVELLAAGRLAGSRWPRTVDRPAKAASYPTADHAPGPIAVGPAVRSTMPDSLYRAVAGRPQVRWRRWFSHVESDVLAATAELVRAGAWSAPTGQPIEDHHAELTSQQADQVRDLLLTSQAGRGALAGVSADELAVVLLVLGAGLQGQRPRPRAALTVLDKLLPADEPTPRWQSALLPEGGLRGGGAGANSPSERTVLRSVLRAALEAMRSRAGARFLSG